MIVLDLPTAWAQTAAEYVRKGLEVHDRFKAEPLVTTAFAPHAPYSVSRRDVDARIRQLADELDVPIHTHLHETASEVAAAVAATGRRPLARLESLGLVTPALIGVHATQLDPAEIDLLATAGASVVHCPRSNLKLASGACPVAALAKAGVNVALGTDGAASNNRLDLWAEMQTAALFGKHVARRRDRGARRRGARDGDDQRGPRAESRRRDRLARARQGGRRDLRRSRGARAAARSRSAFAVGLLCLPSRRYGCLGRR